MAFWENIPTEQAHKVANILVMNSELLRTDDPTIAGRSWVGSHCSGDYYCGVAPHDINSNFGSIDKITVHKLPQGSPRASSPAAVNGSFILRSHLRVVHLLW